MTANRVTYVSILCQLCQHTVLLMLANCHLCPVTVDLRYHSYFQLPGLTKASSLQHCLKKSQLGLAQLGRARWTEITNQVFHQVDTGQAAYQNVQSSTGYQLSTAPVQQIQM